MKLHERLGWSIDNIGIDRRLLMLATSLEAPSTVDLIPTTKWEVPLHKSRLALACYLFEDLENSARYANEAVKDCHEFLYGSWRSEVKPESDLPDENHWRRQLMWMEIMLTSMFWSSCLGQWDTLIRIANYPGDDCPLDPGYTQEERSLYLAIASHLRNDNVTKEIYLNKASSGKKKKVKLIVPVLRAIGEKNEANFQSRLSDYFSYCKKSEFYKKDITMVISREATFLINLARHYDFKVSLDSKWVDRVIASGILEGLRT